MTIPGNKFHFILEAEDEAKRVVFITRDEATKKILAFTGRAELDDATLSAIGNKLSTSQQQRLYEELHVLLASMHLGYSTNRFDRIVVQAALPLDEHLSEHGVDVKAKEVSDGIAAARSLIRKTVC